jgi:hypothetical protein
MPRIDHFSLGCRNIYEGCERLRDATGLDNYDSGWMPGMGVAHRTVPLGQHTYIEVESVIDYDAASRHFFGQWFESVLADAGREDRLMGWVIAVDTPEELQEIADRIDLPVADNGAWDGDLEMTWDRLMPDGRKHKASNVPDDRHHGWPRGLPMFMRWEDKEHDHPDTIRDATTVKHRVKPDGISWVEVGDEVTTRAWLGPLADQLDVRYVDGPAGLYGVGIASDSGDIVIRAKPVPLHLGTRYNP